MKLFFASSLLLICCYTTTSFLANEASKTKPDQKHDEKHDQEQDEGCEVDYRVGPEYQVNKSKKLKLYFTTSILVPCFLNNLKLVALTSQFFTN